MMLDNFTCAPVADARASIHRAVAALDDESILKLQRFLALGTEQELRAKLSARRDYEVPGERFALTPTSSAAWLESLALALWSKLGGGIGARRDR